MIRRRSMRWLVGLFLGATLLGAGGALPLQHPGSAHAQMVMEQSFPPLP